MFVSFAHFLAYSVRVQIFKTNKQSIRSNQSNRSDSDIKSICESGRQPYIGGSTEPILRFCIICSSKQRSSPRELFNRGFSIAMHLPAARGCTALKSRPNLLLYPFLISNLTSESKDGVRGAHGHFTPHAHRSTAGHASRHCCAPNAGFAQQPSSNSIQSGT